MTITETSIFTKIINREIPADIVYEDNTVIAFLTIEPINHGHTLVVPKQPFQNIFDGDVEALGHMMKIAKRVGNALVQAGYGTGVNIIMNNGKDAGQEVFHAHLHVVPRHHGDEALLPPKHTSYTATEKEKVVAHLVTHLS